MDGSLGWKEAGATLHVWPVQVCLDRIAGEWEVQGVEIEAASKDPQQKQHGSSQIGKISWPNK